MKPIVQILVATFVFSSGVFSPCAAETKAEVKNLSLNGGIEDGKARLVIEADFKGLAPEKEKLLFSTTLEHLLQISREKHLHTINASFEIIQGTAAEIPLTITGEGEIKKVSGEHLQDWSVRQQTNGARVLILRPQKTEKPLTQFAVTISAERDSRAWTNPVPTLSLAPPQAAFFQGYLKIETAPELQAQPINTVELVPIETKFLPETLRKSATTDAPEPLGFRFQGSAYSLPLNITFADPESRRVVLRNFQLQGRISGENAEFTLSAVASVKNPRGGSLSLLSGAVALANLEQNPDWHLRFKDGQFILAFDKAGEFPIRLKFNAAVRKNAGWSAIDFHVAPGLVAPVTIQGLAADTQFEFPSGARPEHEGNDFKTFLPPDGNLKLSWKETRPESEGKLFYAAEMRSQISVSPGLMRQLALFEGKVMQGELTRLTLTVRGQGNVTGVQGANILAWNVEPIPNSADRRLLVQFNQAQKDAFAFQIQMQTELGAFPQAFDAMQLRPDAATRFAGHLRLVNEGAVRLEVVQSSGLSQISPDQFPETESSKALFAASGSQRFAFRFSSADFSLRIQADNILPELSVSELLIYHVGETELSIEAEFELDIREAPLREVLLHVPKGFAIARLTAANMSDYFLTEPAGQTNADLRVVYGQPISDRHVIQLRLERNGALNQPSWVLPRVEVAKAKSTRGHIAVSSDPGFRLSPERTVSLTDIATAFFPRKVSGIQAAFRLTEANWEATLRVERLPQTIQADVFHLFSIGEGIAYGSSTINFFISGAPISAFLVSLSDEYFNVEFTGKDLRSNWQKTTNGYLVALNTPVSGAYTLLATYERPFKAQGDTLTFTGARPLDAQREQGHTIVVSAYQFQVTPVNVSPGLLPLETAEVPAEYRLFFDAPILAAYRYTARPFNLQLTLSPLAQAETLGLVVDRAALTTRISKDGEVVTEARYYVKNRGNPHLRLTLPADTTLWSATVNGATVVPVKDGTSSLIALPQRADPNSVQTLELKLASRSPAAKRVTAAAPIVSAPVLLAEWNLEADAGQRLEYRRGSLRPAHGQAEISGFAQLSRILASDPEKNTQLLIAFALVLFATWAWRWATRLGTYRFGLRHIGGFVIGLSAFLLALFIFTMLWNQSGGIGEALPRGLSFLAPVQQRGSALTVEVSNLRDQFTFWRGLAYSWPALVALIVWAYAFLRPTPTRRFGLVLGWVLLAWAALRWPNGLTILLPLILAFVLLQVVIPAMRRLLNLPRREPSPPEPSAARAVATLLLWGAILSAVSLNLKVALAQTGAQTAPRENPIAESVTQEIRVQENFATASAKIHWNAEKDQLLPILFEPGVLTQVNYPTNALKLTQTALGTKRAYQLLAREPGAFDIELRYQIHVTKKDNESGFILPTQHGLVNRVTLTLPDKDVDVSSPAAVSIERENASTNSTVARFVLSPVPEACITWKPRSRDVRHEKAVFFAELFQLYIPGAGAIEGVHQVQIRPAQGELTELFFDVPPAATITDVLDPANAGKTNATIVSLWRFDPDTRKLRVTLNPPQSRPFTLQVRSQLATGPLPVERTVGLLDINNAAGQLGSVGIATGNEVQLDTANGDSLSALNLEDFPGGVLDPMRPQVPGLTLRRAFRYSDPKATVALKASQVEPDVRVETQETLSLGEDRTVLAIGANVSITRAGIFRMSFVLPTGLEVESITGPAMSHWTELKAPDGRVITLHLKGKTEGQQQFNLTLSGSGTKATTNYIAPRVLFREAGKQRGQLAIVPEQGMRLQVVTRDGVTQLDPRKAGIQQKGVLVFRLLQAQWALALAIEQIDAWVQVTSLQHIVVTEAQVKFAANLQYQIENTGLKSFRVRVPTNAESVRFRGEQVADFMPSGPATNQMQTWEVKLHRRIIGKHLLQASWETPLAPSATNFVARGIEAEDANLQRGFVTLQSAGRLQVRADAPPASLQPAEWQSIPRPLRQDIDASTANYTFRLVDPGFQLALALERHEATRLLPARVNSVTLTSVISDEGVMLTQAKIELIPGDKRLLPFTLPRDARFWFAFVNQNGVWPWRDQNKILIPLEQQSEPNKPTTVEFFYSSQIGNPSGRKLDLSLLGPQLDLPLENITWQVYLNAKWRLAHWDGTLQLEEQARVTQPAAVDLNSYFSNEMLLNSAQTKAAEQMLQTGNSLLQQGDPQQARRAFQNAYGLSAHDNAFNEDARVQLHNLKLQQALVGLNVRQSAIGGQAATVPGNLRDLRNRKEANYTQQDAKQIIESNTADDNAALMRLAERLVQQQDAAVTAPTAIRAAIPEQGRKLVFRRAVQVDPWTDLKLRIEARATQTATPFLRLATLLTLLVIFALLAWLATGDRRTA